MQVNTHEKNTTKMEDETMWNYAELSMAAKAAGGPEKLVEMIEEGGKSIGRIEGRSSMLPWMGVAAVVASVATAIWMRLREKKAITQAAVDEAKAELIKGIKDYDATQVEEKGVITTEETN